MMRFICGFATGVYASKYYDFDPAIEYIEEALKRVEESAKKK